MAHRSRGMGTFRRIARAATWTGIIAGTGILFWQHDAAPSDFAYAIAAAAALLGWGRDLDRQVRRWPQPVLVAAVAVGGASTALGGGSWPAFGILVYLIVVAATTSQVLSTKERRHLLEDALTLATAISAVLVAMGQLAGWLGPPLDLLVFPDGRSEGLFKDPNVASAFAACVLPIAVASSIRRRGSAVSAALAVVPIAATVAFTASRSGFGLLALALLLTSLAVRRRPRVVGAIAAAAATTFLVASAAFVVSQPQLATRYQVVRDYDTGGRFATWCYAIELFVEAPLGTGAGSFERRITEHVAVGPAHCLGLTVEESVLVPSAHNTYLRLAVETGVFGAILFVLYWVVLLARAWRGRNGLTPWIAGFVLLLAAGFTIDTLHWRQLWLYAGVLAAAFDTVEPGDDRG